ncbi:hypothetical protein ACIF70_39400 [Actinacidiphila glaucinigra]|uniref:hypothetical protein n=1 Tax=Actinacidiphila glaucinigra TaxID=235986 RepID=UPI0037C96E29
MGEVTAGFSEQVPATKPAPLHDRHDCGHVRARLRDVHDDVAQAGADDRRGSAGPGQQTVDEGRAEAAYRVRPPAVR